ncbi:hypothetical protein [Streptomyces sp. XY66]|uniref:hypothetical protein n=1 Tax=Streptomyces sp. XY66 TaxID=1415563 RepID=UPI00131B2CBE|nr:hypothetical protein [Streptomyces sp. XY66]
MDWGDASSWAALVVAMVAAAVSGKALKHSKNSADSAKKSADAAERSALAAERSAAADEASLAEFRQEASERRAAEAEAARPKPDLKVEVASPTPGMGVRVAQRRYILRNTGTGPAVNVTTVQAGVSGQCRSLPFGVTLRPGEGHEFQTVMALGMTPVTAIHVNWDGQAEPVALPIPQ